MRENSPKLLLRKLSRLYEVISHPFTFILIVLIVIGWFVTGHVFHYDEHWYKAFHIFEMTISVLMVFLIENSTHADNKAMQEKLDELIRALPKADDNKIGLEKHLKGESKE